MIETLVERAERVRTVTGAFVWLGVTESAAYPLMLLLNNLFAPSAVPIMYFYVARLIDDGPTVGFDYYTFVILGMVAGMLLTGSLKSFSLQLDRAIQQGQFETYLVQPISWYTLPFALAAWPIALNALNVIVVLGLGLAFGVDINVGGVPPAVLMIVLGTAATHAVGTLAASVRVISKKADPVVAIYSITASVFSGTLFPVSMLPWFIRWIAYLLPHTYVISAVRRLMMPQGDVLTGPSLMLSIIVLTIGTACLYVVALWLFNRALNVGRRYGVLGGY